MYTVKQINCTNMLISISINSWLPVTNPPVILSTDFKCPTAVYFVYVSRVDFRFPALHYMPAKCKLWHHVCHKFRHKFQSFVHSRLNKRNLLAHSVHSARFCATFGVTSFWRIFGFSQLGTAYANKRIFTNNTQDVIIRRRRSGQRLIYKLPLIVAT